ncbi:TPA: hypothetical protein SML65_004289 [Serratia marcescens]|nr:hypothetical protein [Serratia marcescens]
MAGVIFVNLVIIVCAFWVFNDAANHKVGVYKIKEGHSKGYSAGLSPIVWGVGSLFIFMFFIYLVRRKALITSAIDNPVDTDKSTGFIILFLITSALLMFSFRDILFI